MKQDLLLIKIRFLENDLYFYSLIKAYNNSNALLSKKELWRKKIN